ncbi:L-sorbosone dehydrogenase-like [Paramacrobiotus metropolitanus]|uniref:L-sorbosone dehydrogenase-like n=1 Tax=Paramacrobiotus metropolitanus TaxID=2943436 RepID=UPI0024458ADE|nr:L-sorbosone dehydrogenase-like [Paramacrobiotus metropolitanus]
MAKYNAIALFTCLCLCVTICWADNQTTILTGQAAFGDYHNDAPGVRRKITPADLPAPSEDRSNRSSIAPRPEGALPKVPPGFVVEHLASLSFPRLLRTAPNGDVFVSEGNRQKITILRRNDSSGQVTNFTYATAENGINMPFGIAFHPPGDTPTHVYIANQESIIRFNYSNGDTAAVGQAEVVVTGIPGRGHWTRDIAFSKDGQAMFVAVGSLSNAQERPQDNETDRAMVLKFNVDGTGKTQFATGIRNPVTIAFHPDTNVLWTSVNERDRLGDNLVPDYITRVNENEFYGWPWYYIGNNTDPRHAGKIPANVSTVSIPDVLIQAHSASLQMTFYTGSSFPAEYKNDIFAAQHGSWNRQSRTGYKVIRVLEENGVPNGIYEDFMTSFVTDAGEVWGRPVGVTVAKDGSLWVSDDGSNSVWRVWYNRTVDDTTTTTGSPGGNAASHFGCHFVSMFILFAIACWKCV